MGESKGNETESENIDSGYFYSSLGAGSIPILTKFGLEASTPLLMKTTGVVVKGVGGGTMQSAVTATAQSVAAGIGLGTVATFAVAGGAVYGAYKAYERSEEIAEEIVKGRTLIENAYTDVLASETFEHVAKASKSLNIPDWQSTLLGGNPLQTGMGASGLSSASTFFAGSISSLYKQTQNEE